MYGSKFKDKTLNKKKLTMFWNLEIFQSSLMNVYLL